MCAGIFLYHSKLYFRKQAPSVSLKLTYLARLASEEAPEMPLPLPPQHCPAF